MRRWAVEVYTSPAIIWALCFADIYFGKRSIWLLHFLIRLTADLKERMRRRLSSACVRACVCVHE